MKNKRERKSCVGFFFCINFYTSRINTTGDVVRFS